MISRQNDGMLATSPHARSAPLIVVAKDTHSLLCACKNNEHLLTKVLLGKSKAFFLILQAVGQAIASCKLPM